MILPLIWWLWWGVMLHDPREPADRGPRDALGARVYEWQPRSKRI
ncbi:hypothetical protein AWB80_08441 [Caballeronia pedi]|uniref:Uncharacterized protein n=1 Tax=Caballeronia pedi TaxID=1777141 RepID=A0A158E7E6_9BURK|nr:hypothetical protein [Caballeronia pedi]SAL02792.1 hypothetical protein AWB80_08441 [Caballeronia pedi]